MPVSKALVPDYTLDEDEPVVEHSILEESAEADETISESDLDIEAALSTIDTSAVDIELASIETDQVSQDLASELDDENWDETENYQQFEQTLNSIPPVFFESAAVDTESFFEDLDSSKESLEISADVIENASVDAESLHASSEVSEANSLSESEASIQLDASEALDPENAQDAAEELSVFDTLGNPVIIDADDNSDVSAEIEAESRADFASEIDSRLDNDLDSNTDSNHEDTQLTDQTHQDLRRAFSENISFAGHLVDSVSTDDFESQSTEVADENDNSKNAVAEESELDCSLDLGERNSEDESVSRKSADAYIVEIGDISETVIPTEDLQVVNSSEATVESAQGVSTNSELMPDEVESSVVSDIAEKEEIVENPSDDEKSSDLSPLDITSKVLVREVPEDTTGVDSNTVVTEPEKKQGFVKRWANRVVSWIKRFVGF